MRLCFPTIDDRGPEGGLSAHFGSAPYFTLVDTVADSVEVVANPRARHAPGSCETAGLLPALGVQGLVCCGLGHRAFARVHELGVPVYRAERGEAGKALQAFRQGRLRRLTSEEACHGGRRPYHPTPA